MFKASIALVLVAFAALAYGWIAGNDTILYASIGASALAGLALLVSSRAEKKGPAEPSAKPAKERPTKPSRAERERERSAAADSRKRGRDKVSTTDLLDGGDETEFFETVSEPVKPFRPSPERRGPRQAPAGATWASEAEAELEDEYASGEGAYEAGFEDQGYLGDDEYAEPAVSYSQESADAADDFRSRLAAVLGTGEQPASPPPPERRRARQVTPVQIPREEEPPPVRRGRRRPPEPLLDDEPAAQAPVDEPEPEWIRIDDVPRIRRATQPGGGFARPDVPQGITPYRPPRRPGVAKPEPEPEPEPVVETVRRRRPAPAERTAVSKVKSVGSKRAPASKPSVTRVGAGNEARSRAAKEPDPDAPKPRRGRPPKPKP